MTALVAAEYINLDAKISAPAGRHREDLSSAARIRTVVHRVPASHPLLQESSNEAAMALADQLGEARFVSLMNQKAASLGMASTALPDPAGRNQGNVSSAEDLFRLAQYLYNNRSFILRLSAGRITGSAYEAPSFPDLENFNVFADDAGICRRQVGKEFDRRGRPSSPCLSIIWGTKCGRSPSLFWGQRIMRATPKRSFSMFLQPTRERQMPHSHECV